MWFSIAVAGRSVPLVRAPPAPGHASRSEPTNRAACGGFTASLDMGKPARCRRTGAQAGNRHYPIAARASRSSWGVSGNPESLTYYASQEWSLGDRSHGIQSPFTRTGEPTHCRARPGGELRLRTRDGRLGFLVWRRAMNGTSWRRWSGTADHDGEGQDRDRQGADQPVRALPAITCGEQRVPDELGWLP